MGGPLIFPVRANWAWCLNGLRLSCGALPAAAADPT